MVRRVVIFERKILVITREKKSENAHFHRRTEPDAPTEKKMVFQLRIAKKTIYAHADDWRKAWKADGDELFLKRCAEYRKQVAAEAEKKRQLQVQQSQVKKQKSGVRTRAKSRAVEDAEKFEYRRRTRSSGGGREADVVLK